MALQEKEVVFKSGNHDVKGFLVHPVQEGTYPAIVVIHEIFGLNENIKNTCRRLSEEGYVALAVDLFSADNPAICILKTMKTILTKDTSDSGTQYLKSGIDYLSTLPIVNTLKIGAIGFCMGGNFAIALAYKDRRVRTIAPFYGTIPSFVKDFSKFCPVVGSYPANDITKPEAKKLEKGLNEAGVTNEIKVYPGTTHSFMNEESILTYNKDAAKDAWDRTLKFFEKHLVNI